MDTEAIALCRISSKNQEAGHSLEAQEKSVVSMAAEMSVKITKTWSITQSSKAGINAKRKDLKEITEFCRKNKSTRYLLVDRVSRLMREWKVLILYIYELEELDVKVIFCDPSQRHLNSDDQIAQLMLILEGFKTEQENKERADTTISKMKSRFGSGYYLSHPHPGYMKSSIAGLHVPDLQRFTLLQECCRLLIYKQYNVNQAVQWLNDKGYRTLGGRKVSIDHFSEFIVNPYYCGIITVKSDGWPKDVKGIHEPMLSKREHSVLVSVIQKRNPRIRQKHNPEFPMANIIRHEKCKDSGGYEKFSGHFHNRGKSRNGKPRPLRPVYDCRDCRQRIHREDIHEGFDNFLKQLKFLPSPEMFKKALIKVWKSQRGSVSERISSLEATKKQVTHDLKTAAINFSKEQAGPAKDALRALIEDYDIKLKEIETDIANMMNTELASEEFVAFAIDFIDNLKTKWWNLSYENKKRGEQIIFNGKIYVDNSANVHTPNLSTIYRLGTNKKGLDKANSTEMVELAEYCPPRPSVYLVLVIYRLSSL